MIPVILLLGATIHRWIEAEPAFTSGQSTAGCAVADLQIIHPLNCFFLPFVGVASRCVVVDATESARCDGPGSLTCTSVGVAAFPDGAPFVDLPGSLFSGVITAPAAFLGAVCTSSSDSISSIASVFVPEPAPYD